MAVLPAAAGVDTATAGRNGFPGYRTALELAAGLCVVGALAALVTIRRTEAVAATVQPSVLQPCHDPCRRSDAVPAGTAAGTSGADSPHQ